MKIIRLIATLFLFLLIFRFFSRGIFILVILFGLIMMANEIKKRAKEKRKKETAFDFNDFINSTESNQPAPEKQILFLAAKLKGNLTLADISIHTDLDRKTIEEIMSYFTKNGIVGNKISERGVLVYFFPLLPQRKTMIDLSHAKQYQIEKSLMKLAARNNNRISIAGISINTSLTTKQAIDLMEKLCKQGTVGKESSSSDAVIYYFTEIISDEEKSKAKNIWE